MAYPLPPQAAALLGRSHGVTARILGSVGGSAFVIPVPLVSGDVKVDGGSPVRRELSCQLRAGLGDPVVDPFSAELRAEYGLVESSSGDVWWVPVGTFVIESTKEVGPGVVSVKGYDRWRRVANARLTRPVATSGSTAAAIKALLEDADSRITVDVSAAPPGTHQSSLWERDRSDAVLQLARSIGADVFFNPMGVAVVRRAASISDPSVWQVGTGTGGTKVSSARGVSTERTYNGVVVIGEPSGQPPVYGFAYDSAPSSRTRWGGPYGKRPRFYRSSLISTQAQATAAAQGLLARALGVARTLDMEALPNPALDAGDVITVEVTAGAWQRHQAQTFTLPLGLGTTPITTRSTVEGDDDGE